MNDNGNPGNKKINRKKSFQCLLWIGLLTGLVIGGCASNTEESQGTEQESSESIQANVEDIEEPLQWATWEAYDADNYEPSYNEHFHLDVATYITKIDGMYFIDDCYNNQVIYHDNLEDPLTYWHVLTDDVHYAHTIASDGTVYLVDDTENNRVLVFQKMNDNYIHTQTFENIGQWPHYIIYDEETGTFLAWSSVTGEMYLFKREAETNHMYLSEIKGIPELYGIYVRSFSIIDGELYFVSGHGNQKIIRADKDTFAILEEYPVTAEIAGMAQISKMNGKFYLTVSTDAEEQQDVATIIRTSDLRSLATGDYEDIYEEFHEEGGTPYYINEIEGTYYMSHHRTEHNIISFQLEGDQITDVKVIY